MKEKENLSVIDAAWLRMDRPTNLMMICGMMMFDERVDLQALKETIRTRLLCFHRFRQRVIRGSGNPYWQTDAQFDLDWHVRRIALPDAPAALEEVASDLISTPLDASKPMWQFHLIDGPGYGSVLLLRIHHCYGDGFALTYVVSSMTDLDPVHARPPAHDVLPPGPRRSAWERLFGPVTETAGDMLRYGMAALGTGRQLLVRPSSVLDYAKTGAALAYEAGVIANMKSDSPNCLKGALGVMKKVAWCSPLPLQEVKALAAAFACTVNDLLVACLTGALRAYLLTRGEVVDNIEIRALVPVNLRSSGPMSDLGNHFGLVFLTLPIGINEPLARVREVRRRMAELRHSQQPTVALGILAGMGVAPEFIKERVLEALAANASIVVTNVRGAEQACYLAGARVARQMFWVPQSGGISVGASILSYAGEVSFGLVADAQRVPDPATIAAGFYDEFESMLLSSLMMPWPEQRSGD